MNLATLTTEASAARKRGGGLALRYLLASLLMGRPAMPAGGETKSLCRVAAGITSALPSACESLAYPTKGVRRAQELSLSLRSTTRPLAQPVMGYTHPQFVHESPDCKGFAVPISRSARARICSGGDA